MLDITVGWTLGAANGCGKSGLSADHQVLSVMEFTAGSVHLLLQVYSNLTVIMDLFH